MAQQKTIEQRVRSYVKHCLADVSQDFANLQFDLSAADISPEREGHGVTAENRAELEQLSEDYINRIGRILADLKQTG
jgi:hypothetical protein